MAGTADRVRDFRLDILRILAVLGVVAIHVTDDVIYRVNYFGGLSWWYSTFINTLSRVAVPVFILISGFLLLNNEYKIIDDKKFILKRLVRVGVPLVFWVAFYYAWHIFWIHDRYTFGEVIWSFFTTRIYHLYFLFIIIGLYLLTPKIKLIIKQWEKPEYLKFVAIALALSAVAMMAGYFFKSVYLIHNIFLLPFAFLGYYLTGGFIGNYFKKIPAKLSIFLLTVFLFIIGMASTFATYLNIRWKAEGITAFYSESYGQYFHDNLSFNVMAMSVIAFVIILSFSSKIKLNNFWVNMSRFTFGIYLVHPFILDLVNHYTRLNVQYLLSPLWFYITLKIGAVFIVSYIFIAIVNRIPVVKKVVGE